MPGSSSSTDPRPSVPETTIVEAPAGTLARFEPDERHSVRTESGAKLLLLLAPWPGPGHYRGQEKTQALG